jgi:hypothetical protein
MLDRVAFVLVPSLLACVGAWMFIKPAQYILWLKDARPSLNISEDDIQVLATTKFIGGCMAGGSILILIVFALNWK